MFVLFLGLFLWISYVSSVLDIGPYRNTLLDLHNECRREVTASNMQKMNWSSSLENEAATWADNCQFKHKQQGHGENLAMYTAKLSLEELIQEGFRMWQEEQSKFKYEKDFTMETGHYTQVIWADTDEVGCAMTRCPVLFMKNSVTVRDSWFLVCFYSPPGNIIGQSPYIVGDSCLKCKPGQQCDNGLCSGKKKMTVPQNTLPEHHCTDNSSWCSFWSELCFDVKYRPKMISQCRKTCNLCPNHVCGDFRAPPSCGYWKHAGYCFMPQYKTFMSNNCAKTCGHCQSFG